MPRAAIMAANELKANSQHPTTSTVAHIGHTLSNPPRLMDGHGCNPAHEYVLVDTHHFSCNSTPQAIAA